MPTKRTAMLSALFAGVLLAGALIGTASAQMNEAQQAALRAECRSDYIAHCANVPAGGRASLQCLQDHATELSSPCLAALDAAEGHAAPAPATRAAAPPPPMPQMSIWQEVRLLRGSCGNDYRSYCDGVRFGGGRVLACLHQNEARLSSSCKGALAEARGAR